MNLIPVQRLLSHRAVQVAGVLFFGLAIGRATARSPDTEREPAAESAHATERSDERPACPPETAAASSSASASEREYARHAAGAPAVDGDGRDQAERDYYRAQSRAILKLTQHRMSLALRMDPSEPAEAAVNQLNEYLSGWGDAIRQSPELVEPLADHVETTLCNPALAQRPAALLMMYGRMMHLLPDLVTAKSLDCYFDQAKDEDAVLWEGLDAWKASKLPKPAAVAALERTATKKQTKHRFLSDAEQQEVRRQAMAEAKAGGPKQRLALPLGWSNEGKEP